VSERRPTDEQVQDAAAHAARSVEHRRQMQRSAIQAEAADGPDEAALEREATHHQQAAKTEEAEAESSAHDADDASDDA
jgi:hypothetical protein